MKFISLAIAALLNSAEAHKHQHRSKHHHHRHLIDQQFIQVNLDENTKLFEIVNEKIAKATNLVEVKKMEPACDEECQKNCDAEADSMIREVSNPLNNITWNCKNNYDVYTTDYDPEH